MWCYVGHLIWKMFLRSRSYSFPLFSSVQVKLTEEIPLFCFVIHYVHTRLIDETFFTICKAGQYGCKNHSYILLILKSFITY